MQKMLSKLAGWLKDKTANLDGTVKSEPSAVKVEIEEPQYMVAAPRRRSAANSSAAHLPRALANGRSAI